MHYLAVDLLYDFQCIADACPNTCCAGWNIAIDEKTYQKMVENEEILGIAADDWLEKKDKIYFSILDNERRCRMLNEKNLCNVVLKLGSKYLSDTCTCYPRIISRYGSVMEGNIQVSCPEVIRRLMEKENVQFQFNEDKEPALPYQHTQLYLYESAVRSSIVNILQHPSNITLNARLFVSYNILDKAIQLYQEKQLDFNTLKKDVDECFQEDVLLSINADIQGMVLEKERYDFLRQIQVVMHDFVEQERFRNITLRIEEYFSRDDYSQYLSDMQRFKEYLHLYDNFYINYWICRIFTKMIAIPDYERVREEFIYIATEFCLFQIAAFVLYAENGTLTREEYIYIISFVSRRMDHNEGFKKNLMAQLKDNDVIDIVGLLLMSIST